MYAQTTETTFGSYGGKMVTQIQSIRKNCFVDDGLISVESVDTSTELRREAQIVCAKGKLHPHKFISNNKEVLESIYDSDWSSGCGSQL